MKCVVVDMRNRLFGDAISGSLQHFDSGFRVYQTEGTAAEDLCVDTHADVLVAEVTAYPPWRLEQRLGGKKGIRGMTIGTFHGLCYRPGGAGGR